MYEIAVICVCAVLVLSVPIIGSVSIVHHIKSREPAQFRDLKKEKKDKQKRDEAREKQESKEESMEQGDNDSIGVVGSTTFSINFRVNTPIL